MFTEFLPIFAFVAAVALVSFALGRWADGSADQRYRRRKELLRRAKRGRRVGR